MMLVTVEHLMILLAHCSLAGMGHSTQVDQLELMAAYTLVVAMPKPLVDHWQIATGHSTPAVAALVDLEVYTRVVETQKQD